MRKVLACLFTLVALATAAGYAAAILNGDPLHIITHVWLATLVCMSTVTAFYFFRSLGAWQASLVCPTCHQPAGLSPCTIGQPHPSIVALLLGGIILTILIQHSHTSHFRCSACSAQSSRSTFGSWLALAWCASILVFVITAVILQ